MKQSTWTQSDSVRLCEYAIDLINNNQGDYERWKKRRTSKVEGYGLNVLNEFYSFKKWCRENDKNPSDSKSLRDYIRGGHNV
jgi:hypothetical protein